MDSIALCQGIVLRNRQKCRRPAKANGYCGYHKNQAVAPDALISNVDKVPAIVMLPAADEAHALATLPALASDEVSNINTNKGRLGVCRGMLLGRREKCTRPAKANGYCGYHKNQAVAPDALISNVDEVPALVMLPAADEAHALATLPALASDEVSNINTDKGRLGVCRGMLLGRREKCTRPSKENGYCGYHTKQATESKLLATLAPVAKADGIHSDGRRRGNRRRPVKVTDCLVSYENMMIGPAATFDKLCLMVAAHCRRDKIFIGKASGGNRPEKRWGQKYEALGYEQMQVLCQVDTVQQVRHEISHKYIIVTPLRVGTRTRKALDISFQREEWYEHQESNRWGRRCKGQSSRLRVHSTGINKILNNGYNVRRFAVGRPPSTVRVSNPVQMFSF